MPEIGEEANGTELALRVGEELLIRLPENRMTGFRWHLGPPDAICRLVDESYVAGADLAGSAGMHTWRFQAEQAGEGSITLAYRRPWEQDDAGGHYSVTLRVRGD